MELLLVDDEPDMVSGLRRILRARGYGVDVAHSGEEAVEKTKEVEPDGLLIDIRMPGMNGVEAYRRIRRQCPDAFVIFMTAYSDLAEYIQTSGVTQARDDTQEEMSMKAIGCLTKPFEFSELISHIETAARQRRPE